MKNLNNYYIICFFLFSFTSSFYSQQDDTIKTYSENSDTSKTYFQENTGTKGFIEKQIRENIKFYGEAGAYGELYSISGRERRRKPATGRIYLRPTLSIYESFSISFDLFLSTEGNAARQQIGQIGLQPQWSWGKAYIGDYSTQFSSLTLNGITFRGAGLDLHPWSLKLETHYGQIQRAVKADPFNSVYSRYLFAARVGYGTSAQSGFFINVLRSKDNTKSLPKEIFLRDSSLSTGRNQYGVTPQENLVLGANFGIPLFDKALTLGGEAAGSVFTRDLFSSPFDSLKTPKIVKNIYKPRVSTNIDYAYSSFLNLSSKYFNFKGDYQTIYPGYISHGLSNIISDRKNLNLSSQISPWQNYFSLLANYSSQEDNLLKQKLFTTKRESISLSTNIKPSNFLGFIFSYLNNQMSNDAKKDTLKVDFTSSGYNLNTMVQIKSGIQLQTISLTYSNLNSEDKNILRRNNQTSTQNINLNYNYILNADWNFGTGVAYSTINSKISGKSDNISYFFKINNRMARAKLNNSFAFNNNISNAVNIFNFNLQTSYSFDKNNSLRFSTRYSIYNGKTSSYRDFSELQASLGYAYRF